MAWMERLIHTVRIGKWDEAMELEKGWAEYDRRRGGMPPKRRYRSIYGSENLFVYVWECEWESLAALEAHYRQEDHDPELKALNAELSAKHGEVYESIRREMYYVISLGDTEGG